MRRWVSQEQTLELLLPLPEGMLPLALGPDGRHLALNVNGRRVQLWDLASVRRELRALALDWSD